MYINLFFLHPIILEYPFVSSKKDNRKCKDPTIYNTILVFIMKHTSANISRIQLHAGNCIAKSRRISFQQ